jgi:hypothetical protein
LPHISQILDISKLLPEMLPVSKPNPAGMQAIFDDFVKSRHSRVGGNPESMELIEITGFPFSRE